MGSYQGSSEIVQADDEPSSSRQGKQNSVLKLGFRDSLADDINKLFEAISIKTNKALALSHGAGSSPPMNKLVSKRPIAMGVPRSPGIGNSEPATLKQALRELSLTKASEMAAMKRLSKMTGPSGRPSEAGRIKTLYNTVVLESGKSSPTSDERRGNVVEVSLVPEERTPSQSVGSSPRFAAKQHESVRSSKSKLSQKEKSAREPSLSGSTAHIKEAGIQTIKSVLLIEEEKHKPESIPSASSCRGKSSEVVTVKNVSGSTKSRSKASSSKAGQRVRSHGASSSSIGGTRVNKLSRTSPRLMKSVSRNRNLAKKKINPDLTSSALTTSSKEEPKFEPSQGPLVCERCQCSMKSASKKPSQSPIEANKAGPTAATTKAKKNAKTKEKSEFSQSSQGEYSSSTTMSDESNLSGSSCGNRPHMSKDVRWEAIRQALIQDGVLGLDHFNLLKKLGCGDIGTVYLAELIATNCLFAIKVMDNEFLARRKKMPRAQTEREILRMLDHPFLPTLYSQFTSDNLSCLVMEYCPGGDLHVLRQKQPGRNYSESAARFYVAEVLLALEYLHMLGVVYRDLKPENVLVREDGHIMLTDFDLSLRCSVNPTLLRSSDPEPVRTSSGPCTDSSCAEPFCIEPSSCQVPCFTPRLGRGGGPKKNRRADLAATQLRSSLPQLVAEPTEARSNSFVGTHEYLAPEIIKGDGHGAAVDWWTFGIFLYELLYGRTPFKGANNEETLANVVLQTLRFPDSPIVSFQARDLIRALLVKEPESRFGTEKGAAEIKHHPFFEGLNWALIRCAVPPEVPEFCEFEVPSPPQDEEVEEKECKYLECKATGELLEFELF